MRDMKVTKDETVINANKTTNIPDEMLLRQNELKKSAVEESKRDRTYEEFWEAYGQHLEGQIPANLRTDGRPETAGYDQEGSRG